MHDKKYEIKDIFFKFKRYIHINEFIVLKVTDIAENIKYF